jgi:hypothetical protein
VGDAEASAAREARLGRSLTPPVLDDYSTNRETEITCCMVGTVKVRGRLTLLFAAFSMFQRPHFSDSSAISSNVSERSKSRSERASTEHSYRTELKSFFAETF